VIVIRVSCDDEAFRAVVAELLGHQSDMRVLRVSSDDLAAQADVVVYGLSPRSDVTQHAPEFHDMASSGAAVVVFCTAPEQVAEFEDLGAEYLVEASEPARELAQTVRAAYRQRAGQTIH
jgi:DNA-binding NarL/FixJ family response regulator